MGPEVRRRMDNRNKTNPQLFEDYYTLLVSSHSKKYLCEAKRVLERFREFLGEFPPTIDLGVQFFTRYKDLKPNRRARYAFAISAFFKWYSGDEFPIIIRTPKILPQYIPDADIERLKESIAGKRSYKQTIVRDLLIIETAQYTGLRRGELANLKVRDLHLSGADPLLIVRGGKWNKDRSVNLIPALSQKLAAFVKGKKPEERVFGLMPGSMSMKITEWAKKAGVPQIHLHIPRHNFGTDLFERNANPRAVNPYI
jgi:integrase